LVKIGPDLPELTKGARQKLLFDGGPPGGPERLGPHKDKPRVAGGSETGVAGLCGECSKLLLGKPDG
jgi:hypothetical protein